jgi:hypothetical protein
LIFSESNLVIRKRESLLNTILNLVSCI